MKPRKSFVEHIRHQDKTKPLNESLLSKGYAVGQNAQHNSTRQKVSAIKSNVHSIISRLKNEEDLNKKIDLLSDVADQITLMLERLSELSTNVKNVVVANALFAEEISNNIKSDHRRK